MRIDQRFNGPPASAHGGVACGVFAGAVNSRAANVRLMAPPPLDTDLELATEDGVVTVSDPSGAVAEVRPVDQHGIEDFPWLPDGHVDAALGGWEATIAEIGHPFPTCFGCGDKRPEGDGLELFAGPVSNTDLSAAWWQPDDSLASDGIVHDWAVWAAVDCPSGAVVLPELDESEIMLLGQLSVWVHDSPVVGERYQVVSRSIGRDGRRLPSEVGIVAESGAQLAAGSATWITIPASSMQ